MPRAGAARSERRRAVRRTTQRPRLSRLWPAGRSSRRGQRARWGSSPVLKLGLGLAVLLVFALATNWVYQVICKPAELLFPVSGTLYKTPAETWQRYAPLFRKYSTRVMTPGLLAAIAQVESAGNPIVRTYWRWSWTTQLFDVYRPASSAVGMYQMTDGTFAEARHYCIRNHAVAEDGQGSGWRSCPFNGLYTRVIPGDAVELTSAYLDQSVAVILARRRMGAVTLPQQQRLATLIHLCGAAAGDAYALRGFRLAPGQRCGDHDVRDYLGQVNAMRGVFERLDRMPSR
jgi:hypothetical protein